MKLEPKKFYIGEPIQPISLVVSYTIKEWKNSYGRYIETTHVNTIESKHYDKWNGLLAEVMDDAGYLQEEAVLRSAKNQTYFQINSYQHVLPEVGDGKKPRSWGDNAVPPVLRSNDGEFQKWLEKQYAEADEPNEPKKTGHGKF